MKKIITSIIVITVAVLTMVACGAASKFEGKAFYDGLTYGMTVDEVSEITGVQATAPAEDEINNRNCDILYFVIDDSHKYQCGFNDKGELIMVTRCTYTNDMTPVECRELYDTTCNAVKARYGEPTDIVEFDSEWKSLADFGISGNTGAASALWELGKEYHAVHFASNVLLEEIAYGLYD